ncbi:MAG TPA: hypothetical protein VIA02_02645 [Candidatus Limnocylindria bacterium]
MGTPPALVGQQEPIVYCLTRDRDLALAIDERLVGSLVFFYNDTARLHQAVVLRAPDVVVIDSGAIKAEYGDAGLGPVVAFVRERAGTARIAVRPGPGGAEWLIGAEAGIGVVMLPGSGPECAEAVAALSR